MQFVFRDGRGEHELELRLGRPDAMVADLAAALNAPSPELLIDGRAMAGHLPLAECGLLAGSVVEPGRPIVPTRPLAEAALRIIGGLQAGESYSLSSGRTIIGRGGRADVRIDSADLSREHGLIEVSSAGAVTLTDLRSRSGSDVNGSRVTRAVPVRPEDIIGLGGAVLAQVLPARSLPAPVEVNPFREARPGGTLSFSRAPRARPPAREPPLRVPGAPPGTSKPTFSISAILSPLVMAGAMVAITRRHRVHQRSLREHAAVGGRQLRRVLGPAALGMQFTAMSYG